MIRLHFEKLSRYDRPSEFVECAVPFAQGELDDAADVCISGGGRRFAPQTKVTARWPDGSVKWLHICFLAQLPANAAMDYYLEVGGAPGKLPSAGVTIDKAALGVDTGALAARLAPRGSNAFLAQAAVQEAHFGNGELCGAVVASGGREYHMQLERDWTFSETGPFRVLAHNGGRHYAHDGEALLDFEVTLHFTAGAPWFRLDYTVIHRQPDEVLQIDGMYLDVKESDPEAQVAYREAKYANSVVSALAADGLEKLIDAEHLLYDANEQIPQTLYSTFFADWRNSGKGICVTVYQAHQNFPKALRADRQGIRQWLVPQTGTPAVLRRGMAKTHTLFYHLHNGGESLHELSARSLQMQMPDRPTLLPKVYRQADVLEDVLPQTLVPQVEAHLMRRADAGGTAYGMLCWGDYPDSGYTRQGQGRGKMVWTNNEYDYPHACLLMYARTGERRYYDKLMTAARHWMDVDICHYSGDELRDGAQIMHSAEHVTGEVMPSHEWVEGLLDYYHLTGETRARDCAFGIGENVMRVLETPLFNQKGEIAARETGWALRTFTALYTETGDARWLEKCEWIVGHFRDWTATYKAWLAPYTMHTAIRVPFMIAIAASSLMRYYRVRKSAEVRGMILAAVDDMIENCRLPSGLFYYKELPSLRQPSENTLVLEVLADAYELSGEAAYLRAGFPVFHTAVGDYLPRDGATVKYAQEDAVICEGASPKVFAQSHLPVAAFARALEKSGLLKEAGFAGSPCGEL